MVDRDSEPRSPIKDFGWLAIFLIVLGVIWFAQGGPSKLSSITSPFIKAPEVSYSGSSRNSESETPNLLSLGASSRKGKIFLSASNPRETDPQKEYLEIRADYKNTEPVQISGWSLKGKEGLVISIGQGAYLPYSAQVNPQEPISLKANEKAIVVSGQSPIGTNFRLNICTGYFSQFQTFYPSLFQECPRLSEEDIPINYPDACFDFVKSLARCRMPISVPAAAGNDCAVMINGKVNYIGCVTDHKNDENFYTKEWRIYLGRDKELWGNGHDNIVLLDQEGKLVDEISY